jgi:hypothetical protein
LQLNYIKPQFFNKQKVLTMTNLQSLRSNLSENGFDVLSPAQALLVRGGGGSKKSKKSNKSKKSKKSKKSNGGGYGYGHGCW